LRVKAAGSVLLTQYRAGDKIEKIEMSGGHVARRGKGEVCTGFWWGSLREKRPLGRPRRRWEDNVGMDLQEVGCGCEDWIGLAQNRDKWWALVSGVRNLRVP
jgi:hypothetical protein